MKTVTRLEPHWIIDAPPEEMRLILKALGGRLTAEDIQPAKELGDKITQARADQARHLSNEMSKHDSNRRTS